MIAMIPRNFRVDLRIRRQTVTMNGTAVTLTSHPDDEQQELLKLLEVDP